MGDRRISDFFLTSGKGGQAYSDLADYVSINLQN